MDIPADFKEVLDAVTNKRNSLKIGVKCYSARTFQKFF